MNLKHIDGSSTKTNHNAMKFRAYLKIGTVIRQ